MGNVISRFAIYIYIYIYIYICSMFIETPASIDLTGHADYNIHYTHSSNVENVKMCWTIYKWSLLNKVARVPRVPKCLSVQVPWVPECQSVPRVPLELPSSVLRVKAWKNTRKGLSKASLSTRSSLGWQSGTWTLRGHLGSRRALEGHLRGSGTRAVRALGYFVLGLLGHSGTKDP